MSYAMYWYVVSVNNQASNIENPLAEPVQVYSNIENGIGIFGGKTVTLHQIK
jgi:hypothetical protein